MALALRHHHLRGDPWQLGVPLSESLLVAGRGGALLSALADRRPSLFTPDALANLYCRLRLLALVAMHAHFPRMAASRGLRPHALPPRCTLHRRRTRANLARPKLLRTDRDLCAEDRNRRRP